jgi:hypothetical protein
MALPILGSMPVAVVFVIFALIVISLGVLVHWEYRRLVRSREARMFEQLHNSQF